MLLALTTALSFACFSIFSAVIAAKVIINEYCEKNAVILLSYPINRKSILKTKCIIVCAITAISACISNLLVVILMFLTAQIFHIMPKMNTEHFALFVLFSSILMGILSSAVGIISVVCGWKKRSVIATIVCSLIVVCSTTNLIAAYPNHILWIMLAMSVIFVMIAHFLYHIKRFYFICHWTVHLFVRKCHIPICIALILIKPHRFFRTIWNCYSMCLSTLYSALSYWRHYCRQGK